MKVKDKSSLFNRKIVIEATKESFIKLNPVVLVKNPVILDRKSVV